MYPRRYHTEQAFFSQFVSAEMMGVKYGITREEMDVFAARSHQRAAAAQAAG
jgi:acetyl-CoA acetyltransferase